MRELPYFQRFAVVLPHQTGQKKCVRGYCACRCGLRVSPRDERHPAWAEGANGASCALEEFAAFPLSS